MLVPKWFDKDLAFSNEENLGRLRLHARAGHERLYECPTRPRTAFGHFAAHYAEQIFRRSGTRPQPTGRRLGPAQIDRAVLDALCRSAGCSRSIRQCGVDLARRIDTALLPRQVPGAGPLRHARFVAELTPSASIATPRGRLGGRRFRPPGEVDDGLRKYLQEVRVRPMADTFFKLKVERQREWTCGASPKSRQYLTALPACRVSHGNEQYDDLDALLDLWRRRMQAGPQLRAPGRQHPVRGAAR